MKSGSFWSGWRGWLAFCFLLAAPCARAHPILQNPIWIGVAPDRLQVKLYVSIRELNVVQGLPVAADGSVELGLAGETAPRHVSYVLDHLDFRADGNPLSGRLAKITPPEKVGIGVEAPDRAHFIFDLEYPVPAPPARITFSHTMVKEFPSAPGVPWDLSYAYRFGPVGATPTQFGAVPRDLTVYYDTRFSLASNPVAAAGAASQVLPWRAFLCRFALLGAALGLGLGGARAWGQGVAVTTGAAAAGMAAAAGTGWSIPAFLAAGLAGMGILLASVDNIHRPLAAPGWRRWMLMVAFPFAAGWAAWSLAGSLGFSSLHLSGLGLAGLMGGMLAGGVVAAISAGRTPPEPQGSGHRRYPLIQLASLLVCAGGLILLMDALGLRPWAYWLERFGG